MSEVVKKQVVRFYVHPVLDQAATQAAGKKIFRNEIYISVVASKNTVASRPIRLEANRARQEAPDKERFPVEWERFINTPEYKLFQSQTDPQAERFTPVTEIKGIGPATAKTLEAAGIESVEKLAKAEDAIIDHIKGYQSLREAAQAFWDAL